jgi:5-azacytidine-induced protein 1
MSQLKMMDDKNTRVIVDIKNKFKSDMKDAKEAWMAVEKSKREKWKVEKEKEIKEGTIRGLEPELERMLQKQREEKRKMEEDMSEKVKTEKIRLEAEYMDRLSDFKRKLIEENEAILRKEKDFMASHYESLVKDSGREHQAQLKGLEEKIRKEVEEESIKKRREIDYYEDRIGKIQKDHVVAVQKLKGEFEVEKKELREKYEEERCRFKGSMGEEEKTMRKRVEEEMILIFEKKNEHLREKLTKERDEQIQMIVDRLIKEKTEFVESALNAERHKFKQKKDQYSDELDDLKSELTMYKERLVNEQQRCHKAVVDKDTLEKKVEILVKENEEQRENIYRLKSRIKVLEEDIEKDKLTIKAMERSFQEQLDFERGKARTGVNDRYELEEKHRREKEMLMTDLEERQVKELEALEKRIKVILDRKDREIGELREEVLEKEGLCQKYEDLLERQRKEILGSLN